MTAILPFHMQPPKFSSFNDWFDKRCDICYDNIIFLSNLQEKYDMAKKRKSILLCTAFLTFFCLLCACAPSDGENSTQTPLFFSSDQIDDISYGGVYAASIGGKWRLYNGKGNAVTTETYDFLTYAGGGKFRFQQNDTWGFLDHQGKISFAAAGFFDSPLYADDENILLYKNRISGKIGYGVYLSDQNYNRYLGEDFLYAVTAPSAKKFGIYCAASGDGYVLKSYFNDAVSIPFGRNDRLDYAAYPNYVLITPAASPSTLSRTYSLESGLLLFPQGSHSDNGYVYHSSASFDRGGVFYKADSDARTVHILSSVSVTLPLENSPQTFPHMLLAATKDKLLIGRNVYTYDENGIGAYLGQIDLTASFFRTYYRGTDAEGRPAIYGNDLNIVANETFLKLVSYTPDPRFSERFFFCENGIYDHNFKKITALDEADTIRPVLPASEDTPMRYVRITQRNGHPELLFDCKQKKIVSRIYDPEESANTPFFISNGNVFFVTAAGTSPASGYLLTDEVGNTLTAGMRIRFDQKGNVAFVFKDTDDKVPISCLSLQDTRVSASDTLMKLLRENPSAYDCYAVRGSLYLVSVNQGKTHCYDQNGTSVFPEDSIVQTLFQINAFEGYDVFLVSDGTSYKTLRYGGGDCELIDTTPVSDSVFPFAQTTVSSQTKFVTPSGYFSASTGSSLPLSGIGNCAIVQAGNRYGVLNLKSEYVLPLLYQNITAIDGDFVVATHFNASQDFYDDHLNLLFSDVSEVYRIRESGAAASPYALVAVRKKQGSYALYRGARPYVSLQIK